MKNIYKLIDKHEKKLKKLKLNKEKVLDTIRNSENNILEIFTITEIKGGPAPLSVYDDIFSDMFNQFFQEWKEFYNETIEKTEENLKYLLEEKREIEKHKDEEDYDDWDFCDDYYNLSSDEEDADDEEKDDQI